MLGFIKSFKYKRRKRNKDREQERRKNKYIMKRMSMVGENGVRMSAKEDFCVLLFYPAIATNHTQTHMLAMHTCVATTKMMSIVQMSVNTLS